MTIGSLVSLGLFVISLSAPSGAQRGTVTGVVIDDRTAQPISRVRVSVDTQSSVVETDANGRFTLTVARGHHTITASIIGYALLQTEIDVADVPLEMTIRLLEGAGAHTERVTVSGSLRAASDEVPGATSLHGRELDSLRGAVLDDPVRAMQALPSVTATDDFYSEFAVRGSGFGEIGLVLDGVPTRYLMHAVNGITDGGSIAMINSETLSSVSLFPGSYPQRTGRRVGAEVNLATREGRRDQFHGRVGVSGTSATFLGEGPLPHGKGSWLASVRRSYLDYVIELIDPGAGFGFGFVDAQAKVVYDVKATQQLSMTAVAGRAAFEEGDPNLGANEIRTATSRAWLASLAWRSLPSSRFAVTQRLYSTGLRYDNDNRVGATIAAAGFAEIGWRADALFSPTTGVMVEFGGDLERLSGRNAIVRYRSGADGDAVLNQYDRRAAAASAYGQLRLDIGSRVSVTAGSRLDHWSPSGSTTASPWVNAELRLSAQTRVRAGSGLYRQCPDLDQVHGIHGGGRGLRPQRALHVDAGLEHTLPHQTRLVVNAYTRQEQDMLWTPGAEPQRSSSGVISMGSIDAPSVNALSGTARGLELVVRRDAANAFSGWAGYAIGRLKYSAIQTGERFWADADQRHTLTAYGSYRLSSRASMSARYRYGSNYPMTGYLGKPSLNLGVPPEVDGRPLFYGLVDQRNTLRLPAYSRLDVRADRAFTWSKRRLVVFVEVANVLNRTNLRNTAYVVDRAGRVFQATEPLMPFVPSGGVLIEF